MLKYFVRQTGTSEKKKGTKSDFMDKVVIYVKRNKKYKTEELRSVLFSFISSILTFLLVR